VSSELQPYLFVSLVLWLRCAPLFLLTPYLVLGVMPGVWGTALSWALAASLTPLVIAGGDVASVLTWAIVFRELTAGVVIALGLGLPLAAFRTTGAIAQALAGSGAAAGVSLLGRAVGLTAMALAASAGVLCGVAQLLLSLLPPLRAANAPALDLLWPLSEQLLRAFDLGVSLCAPLLLAALLLAICAGLCGRIAGLSLSPIGSAFLPWLGIAVVSLCVANWLDSLPVLVRAFAQSTARLLDGLP
jgi:flagellar biosynthesis protein FliR